MVGTATNECSLYKIFGSVVQLVRMLPCHGRGRGFESRPVRKSLEVFEAFSFLGLIVKWNVGDRRNRGRSARTSIKKEKLDVAGFSVFILCLKTMLVGRHPRFAAIFFCSIG